MSTIGDIEPDEGWLARVSVTFGWATEPVVRLRPVLAADPYATVDGVATLVPDWTQPPAEVLFEAMVADDVDRLYEVSADFLADGEVPKQW